MYYQRIGLLLLWLLTACTPALPRPTEPPVVVGGSLVDELLAEPITGEVIVFGYLYADTGGTVLTSRLALSGPTPQPLDAEAQQIWLDDAPPAQVAPALTEVGEVRYGPVRVEGSLEGPGSYGPVGQYAYRLNITAIKLLQAQAVSLGELFANDQRYTWQLVQIDGGLLVAGNAALLVEQLGAGGVPAAEARQIKLLPTVNDQQLLDQLTTTASGNARYGPVRAEGIWRNGALMLFSVVPR
jgi:hypothetical protein